MGKFPKSSQAGVSILGLLAILALVGALAGWTVSSLRGTSRPLAGSSSADYLDETRRALFVYVKTYGSLPFADAGDDGQPDANTLTGALPYATLGLAPADFFGKVIVYQVNPAAVNPLNPAEGLTSQQGSDVLRKNETCRALKVARDATTVAVTLSLAKSSANVAVDGEAWSTVIYTGNVEDATGSPPSFPRDQYLYGWLIKTDPYARWKNCTW